MQIRKIAPPSAGDQNLSTRLPPMLQQRHAPPTLSRRRRAHQPRCPCAENNDIELVHRAHRFRSE
jgi:hypothetical protein